MSISLVRTCILYIVILAGMRLMGKRQISQLQTSELVVTLLISDIAAVPMQDTGQPLVSGLIPIVCLITLELFMSFFMMKSSRFRRLLCGSPVVIIENGQLRVKEMKALRITLEDLFEELRCKDVFSLSDVAFAIVETNVTLSIIKKPEKNAPTAAMMQLQNSDPLFEAVIIHDGSFSPFGLSFCGKDQAWAEAILRRKKACVQDVFLMTADPGGHYTLILKEDLS